MGVTWVCDVYICMFNQATLGGSGGMLPHDSLEIRCSEVASEQTLQLLITEGAWPVPSPMCTKHPVQILQSPDLPESQVRHTIPQLRQP